MEKLGVEFFNCDAATLARKLLGKILCVHTASEITIRKVITETESYGLNDTACHAHKGRTKRNDPLFCRGGTVYVYLCYGIHEIFNISAGADGEGQGVMLRGVRDYKHTDTQNTETGKDTGKFIGPGKAAKSLSIDRSFNYEFLPTSKRIWLEDAPEAISVQTLKRIGISYASQADQDELWRFKIGEDKAVK